MKQLWNSRYEVRILALFLFCLMLYLAIAYFIYAPWGYYGTSDTPRIGDPWVERTQGLLSGLMLYRDVHTMTPPLTNYLLIIPSLIPLWVSKLNPWATLSFMLYFALFNLFTAFLLLYMAEKRSEGWLAAAFFLLNPLTFGNAILRRQDEAILTFFFALALFLMIKRHHLRASLTIGVVLLIKLSGVLLIPVGFLNSRNWRYLVVPALLFMLLFGPFLFMAGDKAIFWDFNQKHTQHPFQLGGVSLATLWYKVQTQEPNEGVIEALSALFVVGMAGAGAFLTWKRFRALPKGHALSDYHIMEDITLLLCMMLLLSPKMHAGYMSLLALTMAPLVKRYRLGVSYFLIGGLVILADFLKWPIQRYAIALGLIVIVYALLIRVIIGVVRNGA
jgi:Gpi18-like mannosyltransferase